MPISIARPRRRRAISSAVAAAVVAPTAAEAPLLAMAEEHRRPRKHGMEGDAPGEQGYAREIDLLANVRRTLGGMR